MQKRKFCSFSGGIEFGREISTKNREMDAEGNVASSDPEQPSSSASLGLPLSEPVQEVIPQFYFKEGRPASNEMKDQWLLAVDRHFYGRIVLHIKEFKAITKDVCELPSFFSTTLFRKIDVNNIGIVTRDQFVDYWIGGNMLTMTIATRIFTVLKKPDCMYLTQDDFKPLLLELLASHPGLEFIKDRPDSQEFYEKTVIHTIFYYINRSGTGRITLDELKRGNLISATQHVDQEENIHNVFKYFSYEHFVVICRTFCDLDHDFDFFICKENIEEYGNQALTNRIIDRIFAQVPRTFVSHIDGQMAYEDFVYFMLSEEDKLSEPALEYWFKCIDLDGNGVLTPNELQYFYDEQLRRTVLAKREPKSFENILCQIVDMIGPEDDCCISLRDLKRSKLSGEVFNILFNSKKFRAFENREKDHRRIRLEHENPGLTEWELFAHWEFIRIVSRDSAAAPMEESDDSWEVDDDDNDDDDDDDDDYEVDDKIDQD